MSGFLIAGLASLLYSIVNIIDKALVERYCQDEGAGALVVLSSLFPIVLLPISFFFADSIMLPMFDVAILMISGMLTVAWISLYLHALYNDDVTVVMPLMQLTPVFALILGYFFLNELPASTKLLAGSVIVLGSLILSVERITGKIKFKLLLSMMCASAIIALMNTLFKVVTITETFWSSMFWHSFGIVLIGILLYTFHQKYRRLFNTFIKNNWGIGLSLNAANESLTIAGDVLFSYAILLAPLALVQSMEAYQPIFVFLIGVAITFIAPQILKEDLTKNVLTQKIIGIILVVVGSIWMIQ